MGPLLPSPGLEIFFPVLTTGTDADCLPNHDMQITIIFWLAKIKIKKYNNILYIFNV
jgi:hypothetical protein